LRGLTIKISFSFLFIALICGPVSANSDSAIFNAYKKYAETPTDEQVWQKLSDSLSDKTYTVQNGDTLWEISKVLFADPYFWPKIWALNHDIIFNPHYIALGDLLIFDLGSTERPPSMQLIRENAPSAEGEGGNTLTHAPETYSEADGSHHVNNLKDNTKGPITQNLNKEILDEEGFISPIMEFMMKTQPKAESIRLPPSFELPELPQEVKRRGRVSLPESLPAWTGRLDPQSLIKTQITSHDRPIPSMTQQLKCWVDTEALSYIGAIDEIEGEMHAAHEGQYVFVRSDRVSEGGIYSVVKTATEKVSPDVSVYEKEGDLQILEKVSVTDSLYRAVVLSAFTPILLKSRIVPYVSSEFTIGKNEQLEPLSAKVVSGFCHGGRHFFGDGEIVFLQSLNSTPRVGQHLPIYRNERVRNAKSKVSENPRLIGSVQVLRVSGEWVTATVVSALEEIRTGDGTSSVLIQ